MAALLPIRPHPVLSPFLDRTRIPNHPLLLHHRTNYGYGSGGAGELSSIRRKQFRRGDGAGVVKFGFRPRASFLDSAEGAEEVIKELFGRAEAVLYTVADAAVSSSDTVTVTTTGTTQSTSDWLSGITNYMETVLKFLKDGLTGVHVPYAYGFAIILLTVLVKAATFPLTKKQVESAMSMRSLQPQIKAIQERYAGNQERIQLETARLYKLAGINPLAGCLPTLATIPVWIGLYRALSNVADEGLLTEGFFWIPSLAGPTTRLSGSGISWLFPFVDGHPPLGWPNTLAYLVLPVLLVVSQYISVQIMQSSQGNDPNMKSSQALTKFLPLMIGYFALSVPSGLSLYWFTNNILSTAQQVWLQKLGGANPVRQFSDDIIKEEQPNVQKSSLQATTRKEIPKQVEKLTLEGPRPGERFRQLKEQEARKKQQREEQKRKEEAAASGSQMKNEGHNKESPLVDREHGVGDDLPEERNRSVHSVTSIRDSTTNGTIVNGTHSSQDLKDGQESVSTLERDISDLSNNSKVDGRDEQLTCEELEKGSD